MEKEKRENCKCIICNKPFSITAQNKAWYKERGLELPKRCKECREKKEAVK